MCKDTGTLIKTRESLGTSHIQCIPYHWYLTVTHTRTHTRLNITHRNSYRCVLSAAGTLKTICLLLNWKTTRKCDLCPLRLKNIFLCNSFIIMSLIHYVLTKKQYVIRVEWCVRLMCASSPEVCVCLWEYQCGCRGTQVETKQMSAGAGSVCDRGASESYAGRAAWCSSAVQQYRLNKLSRTRVGSLWQRSARRDISGNKAGVSRWPCFVFFTGFDSIIGGKKHCGTTREHSRPNEVVGLLEREGEIMRECNEVSDVLSLPHCVQMF